MGVFANTLSLVTSRVGPDRNRQPALSWGLAGRLLDRLHRRAESQPRLALVERINLAPRQTLALIEADGQLFLVATSPEGPPVFYPLRTATARRNSRAPKAGEGKSA